MLPQLVLITVLGLTWTTGFHRLLNLMLMALVLMLVKLIITVLNSYRGQKRYKSCSKAVKDEAGFDGSESNVTLISRGTLSHKILNHV